MISTGQAEEPATGELQALAAALRNWAREAGFQQLGISTTALPQDEAWLQDWLARGCHGEMQWMAAHGSKRSHPEQLLPGTLRVISARMDYLPADAAAPGDILNDSTRAYVSRYALGRDYHKLMRKRLKTLAMRLQQAAGPVGYRVFVDSAPVLERALARNAGLGWIGKHTNLINRHAGSWFFLGEIYTDLPLPADTGRHKNLCGSCRACIDICPTRAITAPYRVDARRCISYLTIELRGSIPEEFRPLLGNRIYGCDDCQLVCPWNRYATPTREADFGVRNGLDAASLIELSAWSEKEFLQRLEGSPIRRIGHLCWLRNIAVALGNATTGPAVIAALQRLARHDSEMLREHVAWALARHEPACRGSFDTKDTKI